MGAVGRLDRYQRRHRWLGFPLAVIYKFFDDQGNYLAALIAYYGFLSLFPLMLLLVTVLGFLLRGHPGLRSDLLHSALVRFPIIGGQIQRSTHALTGSGLGLIVGIVGTIYGGLGVIQATQNAFNRSWAVPRQDRPDPIHSRMRSLMLLPVLGVALLVTTGLSGFDTTASAVVGPWGRVAAAVLSVVGNIALFIVIFRILTARDLTAREVAPGAVVAGLLWEVLQLVGTYVVAHDLRGASAEAGLFGVVLGLMAWIYVQAVMTVLCAEVNVVLDRGLWPRALMALFSDTDALTEADKEAYESYSRSERYKSFQDIEVAFVPRRRRRAGGRGAGGRGAGGGVEAGGRGAGGRGVEAGGRGVDRSAGP